MNDFIISANSQKPGKADQISTKGETLEQGEFFEKNFGAQIKELKTWLYVNFDDNDTVKAAQKIGLAKIDKLIVEIKKDGGEIKLDDLNLLIETVRSPQLMRLIKNRPLLFQEIVQYLGKSRNKINLYKYDWKSPKEGSEINSVSQLSILSTLDLLRVYLFLDGIANQNILNRVAALIKEDLEDKGREYGGLISKNGNQLEISLEYCNPRPGVRDIDCWSDDDAELSWQSLKHPVEGIAYYHIHHPGLEKDPTKKWRTHQPSDADIRYAEQTISSFLFSPKQSDKNKMIINIDFYFGKGEGREHYSLDLGDYEVDLTEKPSFWHKLFNFNCVIPFKLREG